MDVTETLIETRLRVKHVAHLHLEMFSGSGTSIMEEPPIVGELPLHSGHIPHLDWYDVGHWMRSILTTYWAILSRRSKRCSQPLFTLQQEPLSVSPDLTAQKPPLYWNQKMSFQPIFMSNSGSMI
jgi:hypothetical protein